MAKISDSTEGNAGRLLATDETQDTVSQRADETQDTVSRRVDKSLPPLDINLTSEGHDSRRLTDGELARLNEPRRSRPRRRNERPVIELDPESLHNPAKMNYGLLLALLMRHKGTIQLTAADLDRARDEELNILFALSPDATYLEVSVVSTESGIIRSPEAKWVPNQNQPTYAAPHRAGDSAAIYVTAADPTQEASAALQNLLNQGTVVQMPPPQEIHRAPIVPLGPPAPAAEATGKPPGYVFPFETGSSPQSSTQSLDFLQTELAKDRTVQHQESAAAARVEGRS